ncbi:nitrate- and nitrite sensing domain-containing protein [Actinocrinis sp.]|uniref:sensor histidine kinase n=1 Tax=Actinocrinis sp. TaxID=1920516 RepID=UPI002C7994A0|nr:nitrate- and nitrite sensing domain-containing protein [Actinocrinis sp.]HXR69422.1 nitrate- and nitrite sensing domain-containing protein [Actinocrinis sp.]
MPRPSRREQQPEQQQPQSPFSRQSATPAPGASWRGQRPISIFSAAASGAGRGAGATAASSLGRRPGGALFPTIRDSDLIARIPKPRAIRAKVVCLLVVPIISLMTLWGLAAVQTAQTVYALTQLKQLDAAVTMPNDSLISALQRERIDAARFLGGAGDASGQPRSALTADYTGTDAAADALRDGAGAAAAATTGLGVQVSGPMSTLLSDLSGLPGLRGEVSRRQVTWTTASAGYGKAISDALLLSNSLNATLTKVGQNGQIASDAWAVTQLARSREMLARQAAIVAQAQARSGGATLDADGYRQFAGAYYSQHELEQIALAQLRDVDVTAYQRVTSAISYQRLQGAQQAVLNAGDQGTNSSGVAQAESTWTALAPGELDRLGDVVSGAGAAAIAQVNPYSRALETKAGAGVLLGLFAVTVSLLVSVWIGRGLVIELVGLRDSALDLARRRLPGAIAKLRAGQEVDLEAEVGQGTLGISTLGRLAAGGSGVFPAGASGTEDGSDEVGQVAMALATVHRAALRAALDRAEAVSGVAGIFLNLARRSQVLLHRQLALLDLMERRIEDPADLEDLFRLDHLATRMRRHAEGLIILSGAAPGRSWRRPVPLMDVVRAAVAEVEDYERVDVRQMPDARVAGAAVADLTHLLAELVENATSFSPPHTRVHVQGALVAAGYALEVEDRGLGMGAEALAEANLRIERDRPDDLLDSDRLGLFVISRLARRHGIRVALRQSAYGGTTAVVLLPKALLVESELTAGSRPAAIGSRQRSDDGRDDALDRASQAPHRNGALVGSGPVAASRPDPSAAGSAHSAAASMARSGHAETKAPRIKPTSPHAPQSTPTSTSARTPTPTPTPSPSPVTGAAPPLGILPRRVPGQPDPTNPDSYLGELDDPDIGPAGGGQVDPALLRASTGPETPGGLPRRVKQASIAPGLRMDPGQSSASLDADEDPVPRTPEQARATMSAYQQGWSRGRFGPGPENPASLAED